MSPKGINYRDLGRISTIESPIKSTSRQLSHDQSEEDWIEVKGKNEKTPIVTKKRVTYSPASVGTPNRMVICMNEMRRRQKRISVQLGTSQL